MRNQNRKKRAAFLIAGLLFLSVPALAQPAEVTEKGDLWLKFGRGFSNICLGYIEIPVQIIEYGRADRNPAVTIPAGTLKGLYYGTLRTLAGVYELVTFPIPIPGDYEPVMAPLGD